MSTPQERRHAALADEAQLLDVVVCTTGRSTVLRAAESVVAAMRQGGVDGEVIVVWQSPAPPPDIPGVRVLPILDISLAHARNRGLSAASAPLVAFVDDDEVVAPEWAASLLHAFSSSPRPDAVFGSVAPLDDIGIPYCVQEGDTRRRVTKGRPPWIVGTGGNMAFDREALLASGGFDLAYGVGAPARSAEDSEVIWRLLQNGAEVLREPAAVVHHPSKTPEERLASRFPYGYGTGRLVRHHREAWLGTRYLIMTSQSYLDGWRQRSPRRRREAVRTARGFLAGLMTRSPWIAPEKVLDQAPPAIRSRIHGKAVTPLPVQYRACPHFQYRAGDYLLHVYVGPDEALEATYDLRERVRLSDGGRIPVVFEVVRGTDSLWVLEQELPGQHPEPETVDTWWPRALDLLRRLASQPGERLGGDARWLERAAAVIEAAPEDVRPLLRDAAEALSDLPSVVVHGDLQRKNLLLEGDQPLGVIDWEHSEAAGLPGHDLLFLICTTDPGTGPARLRGLRDGTEPVLARDLESVGLPVVLQRPAVLLTAAWWAYDETRHRQVPGTRQAGRRDYARLLDELTRDC